MRAVLGGLVVTAAGRDRHRDRGLVVGPGRWAWCCSCSASRWGWAGTPSLGHATGPRSFSVRSGWLVREQAILQRRAVVGWQVSQSVFQRRAGLATVLACVGAGRGGYAALDMAADDVAEFTAGASEEWATTFRR